MEMRYTSQQLEKIVDEATVYMCACPAQVAVQLRHLRELYRYQTNCQLAPGNARLPRGESNQAVHQTIAAATLEAHSVMENCMATVLAMEGWDPLTLSMPEGLRRQRNELLERDE